MSVLGWFVAVAYNAFLAGLAYPGSLDDWMPWRVDVQWWAYLIASGCCAAFCLSVLAVKAGRAA